MSNFISCHKSGTLLHVYFGHLNPEVVNPKTRTLSLHDYFRRTVLLKYDAVQSPWVFNVLIPQDTAAKGTRKGKFIKTAAKMLSGLLLFKVSQCQSSAK